MKTLHAILCSSLLGLTQVSFAQAQVAIPNPYNGEWAFDYSSPSHKFHGALVINEREGSWKSSTHVKMDTCLGRQYPIRVVVANESKLVFIIESSNTDPSCNDVKVVLQPTDSKSLSGNYGKNPSLVITR